VREVQSNSFSLDHDVFVGVVTAEIFHINSQVNMCSTIPELETTLKECLRRVQSISSKQKAKDVKPVKSRSKTKKTSRKHDLGQRCLLQPDSTKHAFDRPCQW
jgi:hypothetical protein